MKQDIFARSLTTNITGYYARWEQPAAIDPEQAKALSRMLDVPAETASVLLRRAGGCIQTALELWEAKAPLPDFRTLPGIEQAVHRLMQAAGSGEKVLVYSDFDADGVAAGVILKEGLGLAGIHNVDVFFPCRFKHGYGFHADLIDTFHSQGVSLIITADCGITGWDACRKARSLGIDVIITDHHRLGPCLPEAFSILNPQLPSWEEFGLKFLTGAGVAYLLIRALLEAGGLGDEMPPDWGTDMLALSIGGDGHPVTGLNRLWIKQGMQVLQYTCRPGIFALLCVSGIFKLGQGFGLDECMATLLPENGLDEPFTLDGLEAGALEGAVEIRDLEFERDVVFALVPRINAAARLSHAKDAFDLLCEEDLPRAFQMAKQLDRLNRERRRIELAMLQECYERLDRQAATSVAGGESGESQAPQAAGAVYLGYPRYSICEAGHSWHQGVVGIAASKVRDRYWRPCALIAGEGPVLKGSVRGIPGLNIHRVLSECKDLLINYGGHKAAGGFSVASENIPAFADKFEAVVQELLEDKLIEPALQLDALLNPGDCRDDALMTLVSLEPFGTGNPRPALGLLGGRITGARLLGKDQDHLELTVGDAQHQVRLVWFGGGHKAVQVCLAGACDLVFTPNRNTYLGRDTVSLFVEDFRLAWSMLGQKYTGLAGYIPDGRPVIVYTWSPDAAAAIWVGLKRLGVEAGLHLSNHGGALAHNAKVILKRGSGIVVSTAPWDLINADLVRDVAVLVVHPPVSTQARDKLSDLRGANGIECVCLDGYADDSITWLLARHPSKEYIEQVWKFLIGRSRRGYIPVWEAGPLYAQRFVEFEGAAYEQQLVLLETCISIMMELGMISFDVVNRIPMFVLHRPKGQVSLSGSPLYVKGRNLRRAARGLMEHLREG